MLPGSRYKPHKQQYFSGEQFTNNAVTPRQGQAKQELFLLDNAICLKTVGYV
jgi:hypothetical protein